MLLVTWKRAEDGQGTVMRVLDTTGQPGSVNVQPLTASARGFAFDMKPFGILTVRLQ